MVAIIIETTVLHFTKYATNVIKKIKTVENSVQFIVADIDSQAILDMQKLNFIQKINNPGIDMEIHIHSIIKIYPMSDVKLKVYREATASDPTLQAFTEYINATWLSNLMSKCLHIFMVKYHIKGLLKGTKIIIPNSLCRETLQKMHTKYLEIEKDTAMVREYIYWCGINVQIKKIVV